MRRRNIICITLIWFVLCVTLIFRFVYNEMVIRTYEKNGGYVDTDLLEVANVLQPYVLHYNKGNIAFMGGDYSGAELSYEKALKKRMPREKECLVRINLALSILGGIADDYSAFGGADEVLELLYKARDVLTEKGCADEQGTGHNDTAQVLKEEIDNMISNLENRQVTEETSEEDSTEENNEPQKEAEDTLEQDVKKAMEERQAESRRDRKQSMDYYENSKRGFNFEYNEVIW